MNHDPAEQSVIDDETAPEYDFSHGIRGKHADAYQRGHTILIHKIDGTTETHHSRMEGEGDEEDDRQ